jgi:hypothetical protein
MTPSVWSRSRQALTGNWRMVFPSIGKHSPVAGFQQLRARLQLLIR